MRINEMLIYLMHSLVVLYIPLSWFAWLALRPVRRRKIASSLELIASGGADAEPPIHGARHFLLPVFLATAVAFVIESAHHPFVYSAGFSSIFLEEIMDVFRLGEDVVRRRMVIARLGMWSWIGAVVYSFGMLWRRVLMLDVTPNAFIYTAIRFLTAMVVGGISSMVVAVTSIAAGASFEVAFAYAGTVGFFVGVFPDAGMSYLQDRVRKWTGMDALRTRELPLSILSGLSVWQQARLNEEGIDNCQNLATADITRLVTNLPYSAPRIIDWVDEAILLQHAPEEVVDALRRAGIRHASALVHAVRGGAPPSDVSDYAAASGLAEAQLRSLGTAMSAAVDLEVIFRYRNRIRVGMRPPAEPIRVVAG